MDVLTIPFNNYLGLQESDKQEFILKLPHKDEYHNHIDTVHASVQFALAEAASGRFLQQEFAYMDIEVIQVLRNSSIKFCCPAEGELYAKATFNGESRNDIEKKLELKNRIIINVLICVFNSADNEVMQSEFEWFITKL